MPSFARQAACTTTDVHTWKLSGSLARTVTVLRAGRAGLRAERAAGAKTREFRACMVEGELCKVWLALLLV